MSDLEKLVKAQAKHLEHLQMRLDMLQASMDSMATIVVNIASMTTKIPSRLKPGELKKISNAYFDIYIKQKQKGGANLSEFPFVSPPPSDE